MLSLPPSKRVTKYIGKSRGFDLLVVYLLQVVFGLSGSLVAKLVLENSSL